MATFQSGRGFLTRSTERCSEWNDTQVGDQLEVTKIVCSDPVAEFECGHPDEQIGEWNTNALGLTLAVDAASTQGDRRCDRMHGHDGHQFLEESLTLVAALCCIRSREPMSEFEQS